MTEFVETPIAQLRRDDVIQLDDGEGQIVKVAEASHLPPIFQDCFGRDGRSVYWRTLSGPLAGKDGVERVHCDTTVKLLRRAAR